MLMKSIAVKPLILGLVLMVLPTLAKAQEVQPHTFWDKPNAIGFAVSGVAKIVDWAQSCQSLGHGSREVWMFTNSCFGLVGIGIGGQGLQTGIAYGLHRRGHHKLERVLPYIVTLGNVVGIAYSYRHRN